MCETEMRMLRWVQGLSIKEHKHNWKIREAAIVMSMDTHLTRRRLQWYGHVRGRGEQDATQQVHSMTVRGAGREEDYG